MGPFVFFDHFGPVTVTPADNHDVRPHPHIGLATLTYLFDGVILHRDNLGYTQRIEPGAINWMTAGSGIVHSERKPESQRNSTYVNHGLQLWLAVQTDTAALAAGPDGARLVVIGGQPLGRRLMWWNFVSTSKARIEQAAQAWAAGDGTQGLGQVPGETERIPLPDRAPFHNTEGGIFLRVAKLNVPGWEQPALKP